MENNYSKIMDSEFAKHVWHLKKELEKFLENKTEEGV